MKNLSLKNKIPVGILGATGMVGQKFIELLANHPWFKVTTLAASERSVGQVYKKAVNWHGTAPIPAAMANLKIKPCKPNFDCQIVFSSLDSSVAGEIEETFAQSGYTVVSNSKNHRMDKDVPLLVPEINYQHLDLVKKQPHQGKIVTNPNCSTIGLVVALKPLIDNFGVKEVSVVTLQALSGAGYPGLASLDMLDNVIPFISGEEDKLEDEPLKIFGTYSKGALKYHDLKISAQCNRVAVSHGHLECVSVKLKKKVSIKEIKAAWQNFSSEPQRLDLPMAPKQPIYYFEENFWPQPKFQRDLDKGMAVSIGRLQPSSVFDYKFVILSHNLIRGAAGGAILNAELMVKKKYL